MKQSSRLGSFACLLVLHLCTATAARAAILAGPITNAANGHIYYLLSPTNWPSAEAEAVSLHGHLATINDVAENTWVFNRFGTNGGGARSLWLGLNDAVQEGNWVWVNGEAAAYRKWAPGEPNNGGGFYPNEDQAVMRGPALDYSDSWNDAPGDQIHAAVVELTVGSPQTSDLWDVSQGITITASSPFDSAFGSPHPYDARDLFGGTFGDYLPEQGNVVFNDGQPAGFVHFVEWKTPSAVTVGSFKLYAFGSADPTIKREFASFKLLAKSPGSAGFDTVLYEFFPQHPYAFEDEKTFLLLSRSISPVTAQDFRAEFTDMGNGPFSGPRIVELDGFAPEPLPPQTNGISAQSDFSTNRNPNGVWSYGYSTALGGPMTLFSDRGNWAGLDYWRAPILLGVPGVYHNPANTIVNNGTTVLGPGQLSFYPGPNGEFCIIRFAAPAKGSYQVSGAFTGVDPHGTFTDVHILVNGVIFNGSVTGYGAGSGPSFNLIVNLNPGDPIDFVVGRSASTQFSFDSTGLSVQIVPPLVGIPPTITSQPQSRSVNAGTNVTFFVTATGTAPLSYQWRRNETNLAGANGPSLTLSNVQPANAGAYSVRVTNAFGAATSSNAVLTVLPPPTNCVSPPPGLVSWWRGENPGVGQATLLAFDELPATSSNDNWAPIPNGYGGMQWNNFGVLNGLSRPLTEGYRTGTVSPQNVAFNLSGEPASFTRPIPFTLKAAYVTAAFVNGLQVRVQGWIGTALAYSNSYTLTTTAPTLLTFNYVGVDRVTFTTVPASIFVLDNLVVDGANTVLDSADSNHGTLAGNASYGAGRIGQALVLDGNGDGVRIGNPTNLQLQNFTIETWVKRASSSVVSFSLGGLWAEFFCYGGGGYAFGFLGDGRLFLSKVDIDQTQTSVAITDTNFHHVAVTKTGSAVVFYIDGVAYPVAPYNTTYTFTQPAAIGARGDSLTGSFYGAIDELSIYNRALSLAEIQAIYNADGAGKCTVGIAPVVTTHPQNQTAVTGANVTFTVTATGTAPLSYQWRRNETNLPGATGASLTLSNVQPANAGNYSVRVSNSFGAVTSSNAVLTVLASGTNCVAPAPGLVSWWRGQGNANDATDGNNGTLSAGMSFVPGKVGQAFHFEGTNANVRVPASTSLNVGLGGGFTIETWINPSQLTSQRPLVEWNDGSTYGVHLWLFAWPNFDDGRALYMNVLDTSFQNHGIYTAAGTITTNSYQHVAATYNKTNGVAALYINGKLMVQQTLGVVSPRTTGDLFFGYRFGGPSAGIRYAGDMDEVSLYSRALGSNEIAAIYAAGSAGKCSSPTGIPPTITSHPQSRSVNAGTNVTFFVTAAGTAPLSYQWRRNQTNVAGATGTSLTLTNVQATDAGTYSARVTNAFGVATSSNAVLTVLLPLTNCAPPPSGLVSWWPAENNANDIVDGNHGTLQAVTFAAGKVGQAFEFNGTTSFISIPASANLNVGILGGFAVEGWINPSTLALQRPIVEWNSGSGPNPYGAHFWISAVAGGGPGCLFANLVDTLGVEHFLTSAGGLLVTNSFQHVALTYDKSSGVARLYLNGIVVAQSNLGIFTPQTSYELSLGRRTVGFSQANHWAGKLDELAIYNRALGSNEIAAIYAAGSAGKCPPPTGIPPTITSQPQSRTVNAGTNVTFFVTATGTAPLSYRWRRNETNLPGATGASLTLSNVQPANAGNYSVRVTNAFGAVTSSNAVLTVLLPSTNCVNAPTGLVSWWRAESNASDETDENHGILSAGMRFVAGKAGQAFGFNGTNAEVRVPASANLNVGAGTGFTIETWINPAGVASQPLVEWNDGSTLGVLLWISVSSGGGSGLYFDVLDTSLQSRGIGPTAPGTIATNTYQHVAATFNKSNGLAALYINGTMVIQQALGIFTPKTTGDLYFGSRPGGVAGGTHYRGALDEVSLYNRALSSNEIAAIYAAGSAGKCPSTLAIPPTITSQPQSRTVIAGTNVTFFVTATGSAPLSYQWRRNDTNLAGATGTSLTLNNVQPANAGNYSVRVTNAFGAVTSSSAVLTVLPPSSPILAGPITNPANGHVYFLIASNTWTGAEAQAVTLGGHLVTINDATENAWVISTFGSFGGVARPLWIGLNDAALEGVFVWVSGEAATYRNWMPGEPNNGGGFVPDEDYVGMRGPGLSFSNAWNDTLNSDLYVGVVEISPSTPGINCVSPPAGLVSWWRAESNANDSVGTNNGTTPFEMGYAAGEVGQAFDFNGTSRRVSVPDSPSFKLTNSLTIEGWIYARQSNSGVIFIRGDNRTGLDPMMLNMLGSPGYVRFQIQNADGQSVLIQAPVQINQWQHIAATLEGTNGNMTLFVNGAVRAQTNTTIRPMANLEPQQQPAIGIGNHGGTTHQFPFNGLIDEVSLYSRALSPNEIQAIYQAGRYGKCINRTPIAGASGLTSLVCNPGTKARLCFAGVAGNTYTVQASTNLIDWEVVGISVADPNGVCEFEDADSTRFPCRYYRVVIPRPTRSSWEPDKQAARVHEE